MLRADDENVTLCNPLNVHVTFSPGEMYTRAGEKTLPVVATVGPAAMTVACTVGDPTPVTVGGEVGPTSLPPQAKASRVLAKLRQRTLARCRSDLPFPIVNGVLTVCRQSRRQRASACDAAPPFGPAGSPHWGGVRIYWDGRGFEFSSSLTRPDIVRSRHCSFRHFAREPARSAE